MGAPGCDWVGPSEPPGGLLTRLEVDEVGVA